MKDKLQAAKDWFEDLDNTDKINYWNDYCDKGNYFSDKIYPLDDWTIDDFFKSPSEIAESIHNSDHFNYRDNYFKVGDIYNDIYTGDWFEDLAEPDDYFFEWLLEKYESDILEDDEEETEEE